MSCLTILLSFLLFLSPIHAIYSIVCNDGEDCVIDCDDNQTNCKHILIDARSALSLELICNSGLGSQTCGNSTIYCPIVGVCNITCGEYFACHHLNVRGGSELSSLKMACTNGDYSCNDISVIATKVNQVNIKCNSNLSCSFSRFELDSVKTVDIQCSGEDACLYTAVSADNVNDFSLDCGADGDPTCVATRLWVTYANSVSIECSDSACYMLVILAGEADLLTVNCSGDNACLSNYIFCPFRKKNGCKIVCAERDWSCNSTQILTRTSYTKNFLQLDCPNSTEKHACDNIAIYCVSFYWWDFDCDWDLDPLELDCDWDDFVEPLTIHKNRLEFNEDHHHYECSRNQCCPWMHSEQSWTLNAGEIVGLSLGGVCLVLMSLLICRWCVHERSTRNSYASSLGIGQVDPFFQQSQSQLSNVCANTHGRTTSNTYNAIGRIGEK